MKQDTLNRIVANYRYSDDDVKIVKDASEIILPSIKEFSEMLHEYIFSFEHARAFLKSDHAVKDHKQKIEYWVTEVLKGGYTKGYYDYLAHINFMHKRIGLPPSYINSTFTFIRRFIRTKLTEAGKIIYMDSVEKILDLNLELLSTQYVNDSFDETLAMIRILRESIDNGYIVPYVQMIVDADFLTLANYECLCRIEHPVHGVILPSSFLEISKQIGIYGEITCTMLNKCFDVFKDSDISFSINLSFLDITDTVIRTEIRNKLREFNPKHRLIIEIVETEELNEISIMQEFVKEMREHGIRIAIDDFGSGFSNFVNIDKLNPDCLKIDGSLIKDLDTNTINHAAVGSIVDMANKLGIATVAEYVHSESVLRACQKLGIDKLQGFFIAKPASIYSIAIPEKE